MSSPFDKLISILHGELQLYRRLQGVLAEEQEALQALAAERLLALANEKDSLALQLKALDESRRLAIESIAERFGQEEAESLRLGDIAALAPETEAAELRRLGAELRAAVEGGQTRNVSNRCLANHSLQIVREAIRVLAQPDEIHKTYRPKGALRAYRIAPQVVARQA